MSELADLINGVMAVDPSADALEFGVTWWTWGDLGGISKAVDQALTDAGLGAATRIGGILRNTPEVAATLVSVITTDRCIVTLNPSLPDDRLAGDVLTLKPGALIALAQDWARPAVIEAARSIGCLGLELTGDLKAPVRVVPGLEKPTGAELRIAADPGVGIEMLTSGTTGAPKRIPLKTYTLERAVIDAGLYDGRDGDSAPKLRGGVTIANGPFAHIGGIFGLFNTLAGGRKMHLMPRFTVEEFVDSIRRHRPRVANSPPAALKMLMDANIPKEDLASLKVYRTGTAPLDPDLADAFFERYGIPVLQNYSATEFAGAGAGWTIDDFLKHRKDKRGSVGRVNPGVAIRVVDGETGEELPRGEQGIMEIKAGHLGDGKSWLRTTDFAVLDADDFLFIKGRSDNAIIRGGFKVIPDDVVAAIEAHPAVREAAVVALPDARLGQVPVAAFIPKTGATAPTEDEMKTFLRERLLPYQVPVQIKSMAEMPRTPSLKVSGPELKKLFEPA